MWVKPTPPNVRLVTWINTWCKWSWGLEIIVSATMQLLLWPTPLHSRGFLWIWECPRSLLEDYSFLLRWASTKWHRRVFPARKTAPLLIEEPAEMPTERTISETFVTTREEYETVCEIELWGTLFTELTWTALCMHCVCKKELKPKRSYVDGVFGV